MRIILAMVLLFLGWTVAFADTCPPVLDPNKIPAGWQLTHKENVLQPIVPFDYALWNGRGDGTIDCVYFDTNLNMLIISSYKSYPTPDAKAYPLWNLKDGTGWCNIMSMPIHPGLCTFG